MNKKDMVNILQKKHVLLPILFLISFLFMSFFSGCLPFFYDSHEFHTTYTQMSNSEILLEMSPINTEKISIGPRPIKAFITRTIFNQYGYDYCPYRTAYAIIFGLFILVIFIFANFLFKGKIIATIFSLYIMTNFPLYIQILAYGPHLYGELFKILAIMLFLKDIGEEQTSYSQQLLVYLLSLFAVRSYISAFSIAGILPLFTLLFNRKRFMRYIPLFFFIILIQFPITFDTGTNAEFSPNLWSIKNAFLNNIWEEITSPIPSYSTLYYKSFTGILSFFGFWLIVIIIIGLCIQWRKRTFKNKDINKEIIIKDNEYPIKTKMLFSLSIVWMLCELPSYIMLPEHAIRYIFPFTIPFFIFVTTLIILFVSNIENTKRKKVVMVFILLMVIASMLVSTSYIYAFRAGWGSSFIGFENVMDYFAEDDTAKTGVLYYAGSVAAEYKSVNKSSLEYKFDINVEYIKTATLDDFSELSINEYSTEYEEFYILKRITSLSKSEHPQVTFEDYQSLKEITVIEGYDEEIIFDRWNGVLMSLLGTSYEPNKIYVYQLTED